MLTHLIQVTQGKLMHSHYFRPPVYFKHKTGVAMVKHDCQKCEMFVCSFVSTRQGKLSLYLIKNDHAHKSGGTAPQINVSTRRR
jgi:hypothetical protein